MLVPASMPADGVQFASTLVNLLRSAPMTVVLVNLATIPVTLVQPMSNEPSALDLSATTSTMGQSNPDSSSALPFAFSCLELSVTWPHPTTLTSAQACLRSSIHPWDRLTHL